jgi:hypothetical protein
MALNEVTVTIKGETSLTYHETFLADLMSVSHFFFNGVRYNLPFFSAGHYEPGFWDFPLKFGMWFEQHKLLGSLFDWFGFRKKAVHMVGFLYDEGTSDPVEITAPPIDWALFNNHLKNNTTIEEAYRKDAEKLEENNPQKPFGLLLLIGVVIVVIVVGVVLVTVLTGQHGTAQALTNSTLTPSPLPGGPTMTPYPLKP